MRRKVIPDGHAEHQQGVWELSAVASKAQVVPRWGGMVRFLRIGDDAVLHGDATSGGVQVLFPCAGALPQDRYEWAGRSYPMRAGGLARQAPWEVRNVAGGRLQLELRSSELTRASYPFDFRLRLVVDLDQAGGRSMALNLVVENQDRAPMPVHLGVQLSFQVADLVKDRTRLLLGGKAAPLALAGQDLDERLPAPERPELQLEIPERAPRRLRFSGPFSEVAVATVRYKDYVAVALWSAPAGALATGAGLRSLAPGDSLRAELLLDLAE